MDVRGSGEEEPQKPLCALRPGTDRPPQPSHHGRVSQSSLTALSHTASRSGARYQVYFSLKAIQGQRAGQKSQRKSLKIMDAGIRGHLGSLAQISSKVGLIALRQDMFIWSGYNEQDGTKKTLFPHRFHAAPLAQVHIKLISLRSQKRNTVYRTRLIDLIL